MDCVRSNRTVEAIKSTTDKCLKRRLLFNRKSRRGGQTTVEFALILLPFFAILFAIVDFAQIFFYEQTFQNALRESARFATAGRVIQTTNTDGSPAFTTNSGGIAVPKAIKDSSGREASRNECIRYWFMTNCVIRNFPISNITIISASTLPGVPASVTTNSTTGYLELVSGHNVTTNSGVVTTNISPASKGPGNANDYVQITATYQVNTITPMMSAFKGGYSRGGWSQFPVHVSAIVKNEPALLNFQHTNMYSDEP